MPTHAALFVADDTVTYKFIESLAQHKIQQQMNGINQIIKESEGKKSGLDIVETIVNQLQVKLEQTYKFDNQIDLRFIIQGELCKLQQIRRLLILDCI